MAKKNIGNTIRAYRKSGRMFGETFHTGSSFHETPEGRKHACAMMEVKRWFRERHQGSDPQFMRECIRESITELRELRARLFGSSASI